MTTRGKPATELSLDRGADSIASRATLLTLGGNIDHILHADATVSVGISALFLQSVRPYPNGGSERGTRDHQGLYRHLVRLLHRCYAHVMATISQRELRNDSGAVLREIEAGKSFTVTRRGEPIAELVPYTQRRRPIRPARAEAVFNLNEMVTSSVDTETVLDDLRGQR